MSAIPNGTHTLHTNSDAWAGWRARCSCGRWNFADQSKHVIRSEHDAHLQAVIEAEDSALDQIATDAGIRDGAK